MLNLVEAQLTAIFTGSIVAQDRVVPAFIHSAEGQPWSQTFPCLSYDLGAPIFDPTRYISDRDPIATPKSLPEQFVLPDGSVRTGTRRVQTREHPNPYKIPVMIHLWAKVSTEINDMCDNLLRLAQPKGTITFVDDLGTQRTWWMFLDDMKDLSDLTDRLDEQRKFHILYTYMIDGWLEDAPSTFQDRATISSDPEVNIGIKDT